jgi:plasmid stability protein
MKNITVSVDDEIYRKARIRAAELDTSVSAVVRKYLTEFAAGESRFERLRKQEEAALARIERFTAEDLLPRDALHDRKLHRRDIP